MVEKDDFGQNIVKISDFGFSKRKAIKLRK
jgi:hypothetical protein